MDPMELNKCLKGVYITEQEVTHCRAFTRQIWE